MKISASIYSNGSNDLSTTVAELKNHHIDYLHVDCLNDLNVLTDVAEIRDLTKIPIDLHLITDDPTSFQTALDENPVDLLTIQLENLKDARTLPKTGFKKLGLALTSATDIVAFSLFEDQCDFVLLMATEPGKSGGTFKRENFKRIREFKKKFPTKQVHVDGGVNAEVSFILRNLGVHCAVSGSYLFNQNSVGDAVTNLKRGDTESHYTVADFMIDVDETPAVSIENLTFEAALRSIEDSQMAFTTVVNSKGLLEGIISNADVRKGLLNNLSDLNKVDPKSIINRLPITVRDNLTVKELLRFIRHQFIPINFLPVVNSEGKLTGSLTFHDLIKGEA